MLRGEESPGALIALGFTFHGEPGNLRIDYPSTQEPSITEFPLSDFAHGLVTAWARGTGLDLWASVVLMTDWIEIRDLESTDGEVLLDALYAAAAGEEVSDEALAIARRETTSAP